MKGIKYMQIIEEVNQNYSNFNNNEFTEKQYHYSLYQYNFNK